MKILLIFALCLATVSTLGKKFVDSMLDKPVVYYSNSKSLRHGEKICAYVQTKNGKEKCSAYSRQSRAQMAEDWAH